MVTTLSGHWKSTAKNITSINFFLEELFPKHPYLESGNILQALWRFKMILYFRTMFLKT
jgi:hypothetical protein